MNGALLLEEEELTTTVFNIWVSLSNSRHIQCFENHILCSMENPLNEA